MTEPICVYGVGHLGSVTAACLADSGTTVIALDQHIEIPDNEPQLSTLFAKGLANKKILLTHDYNAVSHSALVWVTFDTPLDDNGHGQPDWITSRLLSIRPYLREKALILISSQVPVGFTKHLQNSWFEDGDLDLRFAYSPENLRKGRSIEGFLNPSRVIVGLGWNTPTQPLIQLLEPFSEIIWMSLESAEMSKHALNGFLAISAAYANELGRLSKVLGVNYDDVELALRTDPRIGRKAYVATNGPISGGSLLREINVLKMLAESFGIKTPVIDGVIPSNQIHDNS